MNHRSLVLVLGGEPPATSVSWAPPEGSFSGYVVIYAGVDPDDDETAPVTVCLDCLLDDDDGQLGRGLDLARRHGQVDWDGEGWFVPDDAQGVAVAEGLLPADS